MKHFLFLLFTITVTIVLHAQQPGTIDKNYGGDKTGTVSVYNSSYINSSVIQPDDKLVLGGALTVGNKLLYTVTRYNKDGSADTSFGTGGQASVSIDNLVKDQIFFTSGLPAITLQSDGKIVAAGDYFGINTGTNVLVVRFLADGTPDESFGSHGRVITSLGLEEHANSIAVQSTGKIVVGGYQSEPVLDGGNIIGILLIRYNPDGSTDKSFGDKGGYTIYTQERGSQAFALLLQPDDKIIAGGTTGDFYNFLLVRFLPDGMTDETFGKNGEVKTSFGVDIPGVQVSSLAFDSKGRIAATGTVGGNGSIGVARYLPDGSPDNSFNKNGQLQFVFSGISYVVPNTVLAQPDGKLVISSVTEALEDTLLSVDLTGLNEDGSFDASFGTSEGQTVTDIRFSDYITADAAMQSDGKIIISGNHWNYVTFINTYLLTRFYGYPVHVSLAVRIKRYLQNHTISWQGLPAENKIAYYSVEQSSSSIKGFTQVVKVSGRSNLRDYGTTNSSLLEGRNYYRVKAVSNDGTIRYSEVVSADNTANTASIFPNPAKEYVTVQGLPTTETANISISDGSGNVKSKGVSNGAQHRLQVTNLQPGTYYVNITTGTKTETLKFVKE